MIWDLIDDNIVFIPFLKLCAITKRGILSLVSTIFNPLSILAPGMLESKSMVQGLWKSGLDWDESGLDWNEDISLVLENTLKNWLNNLKNIGEIKLARSIGLPS